VRDLEHAAFASDDLQRLLVAHVGDVLAEHDDARVPRHLVLERGVDRGHHGVGLALRLRLGREVAGRRIDIGREDERRRRRRFRSRRAERFVGRLFHFALDRLEDVREVVVVGDALGFEELPHPDQRIAPRFRLAFTFRLVQPLVVRERVRVGANHRGVDERRPLPLARVDDGFAHRAIAREVVGAIASQDAQARKAFDQARDVAARRLHVDGHRDRVAVVLDEKQHRQLPRARRVERFPELALARAAVAD
jgi:hypothetical protein